MKNSVYISAIIKTFKKHLKCLLLLVCFTGSLSGNAQVTIPDPEFRKFLKDFFPTTLDQYERLIPGIANQITGEFNCEGRLITNIEGIQYFTKISALRCGFNRLTYIPSLENYSDNLLFFDCSNNQLTQLPQFRTTTQNLAVINFPNNLIDTLPALTGHYGLVSINCINNKLTFTDLLTVPKQSLSSFIYSPQLPIEISPSVVELTAGSSYTFETPDEGFNSTYKLYNNKGIVNTGSTTSYQITDFNLDHQSWYYWQIKNAELPDLTLYTTKVELSLTNKNAEIFTPDGDNINDTYYINCTGTIKIFNRFGIQIKELQGPVLWDGTDLRGVELPIGAYIIQCSDGTMIDVTLVK